MMAAIEAQESCSSGRRLRIRLEDMVAIVMAILYLQLEPILRVLCGE